MPLSAAGYTPKTFEELVTELKAAFRSKFGDAINLEDQSTFGQEIAIFAKFLAENYEDTAGIIQAVNVFTAYGISVDFLLSLAGLTRQSATYGIGTVTCYGDLATVIPVGTTFSVDGDPTSTFSTTAEATIAAGTDEVQTITFSDVPDAGAWTLTYDGVSTGSIAYNAVAADIETALESLSNLDSITVTGNFTDDFVVTFTGTDGSQPKEILQIGTNTLTAATVTVTTTVTETTSGVYPNVDVAVEADTAGAIQAYAGTLTVIETPVSGLDSVTNQNDIDAGQEIETDAEAVLRRQRSLSTGKATLDAIYRTILEINEVEDAKVYENDTDSVDAGGRPPHSIQAVVLGGVDQDIVDAIGSTKGAGCATYGTEFGSYTSAQGTLKTVYFDRPTEVPIYISVTIQEGDDFPAGGADTIKQNLVTVCESFFGVGDVIAHYKVSSALTGDYLIAGMDDVDVYIGLSASPVTQTNLTLTETEVPIFDTANIEVNLV